MIQQLLINALLRQLLDPDARQRIADFVAYVADMEISGAEKRDHVVSLVRETVPELSGWMINLAIELLVAKQRG